MFDDLNYSITNFFIYVIASRWFNFNFAQSYSIVYKTITATTNVSQYKSDFETKTQSLSKLYNYTRIIKIHPSKSSLKIQKYKN